MNTDLLLEIQNAIEYKFNNHIYPELVNIIKDYIFINPDKLNIYKNTKVTPLLLLKNLAKKEELIKGEGNISVNEIINYIKDIIEEGHICYS
ncbi:MAG: hypothetical protein J6Y28_01010 [Acholeplasmatales bacterium]|nr:hypothetical protein [Acholeplasmatales bacterium]